MQHCNEKFSLLLLVLPLLFLFVIIVLSIKYHSSPGHESDEEEELGRGLNKSIVLVEFCLRNHGIGKYREFWKFQLLLVL